MKKIAVTGYYGTGSSAVVDLLSEVDGVEFALGRRYEHTNLNCRDGLFDLEAILYSPNTCFYSRDMALNRFIDEMEKQYKYNFGWYGTYKKYLGKQYIESVYKFIGGICCKGTTKSLAHTLKARPSLIKAALQIAAHILIKRDLGHLGWRYVRDGKNELYLTATHEEFIEKARVFINEYFDMCQKGSSMMVYDHLLFPEQCGVVPRLFDNEFKMIIVDRDPRDIYLSDKFVWSKGKSAWCTMPMPAEVHAFCKYWRAMHDKTLANMSGENIIIVKFEDLLYKYDEEVKRIFEFCGIDASNHKNKGKYLDPARSVKNTQLHERIAEGKDFCDIIEKELSEYIYNFPYKIEQDITQVF